MKEISDINGWMTSGRFIVILKYDITAVYKIKNEDKREDFFLKCGRLTRTSANQSRANVGDITTGGKPALCSRVDSLKIRSP